MAKAKRKNQAINVDAKLHARFLDFCRNQSPKWPLGQSAEMAIQEFMAKATKRSDRD
jgi:hypothetical protein